MMTDPIADMLTRIRNAVRNQSPEVSMPSSRMKVGIAHVLKTEGFINDFSVAESGVRGVLNINLKYGPEGEEIIRSIARFSKPGCRRYRSVKDIPSVLNGLGIAILSTPKGILSDRACRNENVGGEVLCEVY